MLLSLNWLEADYGLKMDAKLLADKLTMAGLEVDAVLPVAGEFSGVVVAEVLEVLPHPNADKLHLTRVNAGTGETLNIVCGAPNVRAGMKVPCALIGARLTNKEGKILQIKATKLRGEPSNGMLCSARELGLSEDHSGLMNLPADAPIGENIRDYLKLDDWVLDIDLTPNRGDCFSLRGLAREVSVLFDQAISMPHIAALPVESAQIMPVRVEAPQACPLYCVRRIEGVNAQAPTPLWMQERLRRSGMRSISALVDITNYVMLEMGTPLHAFDADKIVDGICVREAHPDEKLLLLNGNEVTLHENTLLICDAHKPLAIAGVMGGEESSCSAETRNIAIEAAWFDPVHMAGVARSYGLATDSSQRYERGVDYALPPQAIERAAALVKEICGGQVGKVECVLHKEALPQRHQVTLKSEAVTRRLGRSYEAETIRRIFKQLHFHFQEDGQSWRVESPSWRFDIEIPDDLIEEIARIDGYDAIPLNLPRVSGAPHLPAERQQGLTQWRSILSQRAYHEAICFSFLDEATLKIFGEEHSIALQNPISRDLARMRTLLVPGLVRALEYNRNRRRSRARLFESGKVFLPQGEAAQHCEQQERLAGAAYGSVAPEQWGQPTRPLDFFDLKNDVEALLAGSVFASELAWRASTRPFLHPGQSADIYHNDLCLGFVGALHPQTLQALGIKNCPMWVFELRQDALAQGRLPHFQALPRYPFVRRDLALLVEENVPAAELLQFIRQELGEHLVGLCLFDAYQGDNVPAGKKSLALGMELQDFNKTLLDEEVEAIIVQLIERLKQKFNSELR